MVVAPWWVRWLVSALLTAVMLTAIGAALFPNFVASTGWLWALVALAGFSLAVAAPVVVIQNPVQRSYAAALTGLNHEQRTHVMKALRRGEVPSDSRVVAAAIRVGTINLAYLRRAGRWQSTAKWWVPAIYILVGVLAFIARDPRRGLLWVGFALFFAANFAWTSHKQQRISQRVEFLRGAAADIPEAAAAAAETEDSVALPKRRTWVAVVMVVVVGIGFGIVAYLSGQFDKQTPDCRTADSVVDFIHAHPDMFDARLITPGDPGLNRYQDWSDQLKTYARQVSTPDISRHLHRIADLSAQAVALVQDIRKDPVISPSPDVIRDHETAYQNTLTQLVAEEGDLVSACHPRH
ncbi:hypothetical protein BST19_27550 [Mycobacterium bouchedurhonense]|uniref:Integral membrane protein n=2 Tax=Mycobacterium avium complex (MAC) TaxID=120793 RepID=A0ABX3S6C5_MYCBC|nr:hypothetical protein BST19_27550 [Mycobacterium bouchedurhonense]